MKKACKIRFMTAILVLILAIFGILGVFYPVKVLDLQFAPLIQRVFVDFSVTALLLLGALVLLTVVFGRIYCSLICPFGILQEIAALIFKRKKNKCTTNFPLKYFIAAVVFGVLAGGSALVLRYIEPYTYFGSAFSGALFGIAAVLAVMAVVFFKNRFFCTNICPVGTLLGLISKISVKKIFIQQESCVSCGMCERNCQSSCINSREKTVDNEMCVKCFKCLSVCPKNAIKYGKKPKSEAPFNLKRRQVIIGAAALALFGGMAKAGLVLKDRIVEKFKDIILPPGAVSEEHLANKCFNCNLCVANCPNKILVKADKNFPVVHIDCSKGFCKPDCTKCSQVCPTGAIKRLKIDEKQRTRIAMAMITREKCTKCGICKEACPYGAIIFEKGKTAFVDGSKCIGCGACKVACHFGAINIFAVKQQKTI